MVKPKENIKDFEFPDSGLVMPKVTSSDWDYFDKGDSSSDCTQRKKKSMKSVKSVHPVFRRDIAARFYTSILVVFTMGTLCMITHLLLMSNSPITATLGSVFLLVLSSFSSFWTNIHGLKLSRKMRPMLDIAKVLNENTSYNGDVLAADNVYKAYNLCCDPKINEDIPRTAEEDDAHSPPSSSNNLLRKEMEKF